MIDLIVEQVIDKYRYRSEIGAKKYGTTLHENNADNYLIHLQEELQDATLYIEKILTLKKELTNLVKKYPNDADLGEAVRRLVS